MANTKRVNLTLPSLLVIIIHCFLIAACDSKGAQITPSMDTQTKPTTVDLEKASLSGDEVIDTPIGTIELVDNYFDDDASQRLYDEMDYQRAVQLYIWSTPLVSTTTWRDELTGVYDANHWSDFVVLQSLKERTGIVTGNLTTPYIFNFTNLLEGPVRIDYPAGQTAGGVLDLWMRPVMDVGLTGPDQGKGATYIIVGPQDDPSLYEEEGVHVFQSATNNVMIGTRIIDPDPAFYKSFKEKYKMGRVGDTLKPSRFIENLDREWSGTVPRGLAYWKRLASIIQEEPVREIDKPWMAMLEPLGIAKGKSFSPSERQKTLMLKGGAMGELMTRNLQITPRYTEPYWPSTQWYKSFDFEIDQETDTIQQIDQRATWFYEAIGATKGMVNPQPGAGQVYMTTKRDSKGEMLRADRNYKLHVPADVPVKQFWSVTLYSENTRRPYENGGTKISDVSLGSRTEGLQKNDDGSVDIFIGPKAPQGKENNHLKTVNDDGWFVYFRLYAPLQPFFDKSFGLPDFEQLD